MNNIINILFIMFYFIIYGCLLLIIYVTNPLYRILEHLSKIGIKRGISKEYFLLTKINSKKPK